MPVKNNCSIIAIDAANDRVWDSSTLNPLSTLAESNRILDSASIIDYPKGQADAILNIGWSMYYLSRLPEAYDSFSRAQRLYKDLGDVLGLCRVFNAFGVYYHAVFTLDKAIYYYTQSLETAKANDLLDRELIAMGNLGELCLELGNPQEALDYLVPAYDRMYGVLGSYIVADCLRNIGEAFLAMDNLALATEFTERSYEIALAANETIHATDSIETLATVAIARGDLAEAEALVSKGLALVAETGNLSQRASLLIVRGSALNDLGQAERAFEVLLEAEQLCESIRLKSKLFKAHEQLSRSYEAIGDYERALFYFKRFADFRAQVQHEDTVNKLRNVQTQSETERAQQEAEIYRLKNIDLKEKSEALEDSNRQIMSISSIGRRITASLDFGTVVQTIYECLKPYLEMDMFGIALHDPARGQLVYRRYYEDGVRKSGHRIDDQSDSSFAAWAFRNRKPVLISDKDKEYTTYLSRPSTRRNMPSQSIVCLPLFIEEKAIGVMTVQSYRVRAYTASHLSFVEALAPYIGIAVENAIIHDRLEELNKALSDEKRRLERATLKISHLANHDSLTGLPNRRLLFELMGKSVETAKRADSKIGVVFMDLDDFKPINDMFGHAAGDSALIAMSERIRGLVRASDIVARIGGDEFVAIVTNVRNREDIERVAKKIVAECARPLSFSGKTYGVGLSMGISVYPDDGEIIEELVNKADSAMYRVKHIDKNSYSFSSE
ncbi:MAG: hypothetical protein CVV47_00710 [Spirochaetae bacterium HGW-Spirochaetae-3]|jgi:diguanylate cyclase (GGDEF)-like protein|nr:MAG: hypothetical protein CVV47_00710 [Spirochaetae bacterium HGW-Spirochaetae-3]